MNIKELSRAEIPQYLKKNYSYSTQVYDDFCSFFLHKRFNLENQGHMFYNQMINLIKLKRGKNTGIEGYITNDLKKTIDLHKAWDCDLIYITDHTVQMKDL